MFDLLSGTAPLASQTLEERAWACGRGFSLRVGGPCFLWGRGLHLSFFLTTPPHTPKGGASV